MRLQLFFLLLLSSVERGSGAIVSSDFNSFPVHEGWNLVQQYCEPITWIGGGWYHQLLDFDACPPPPDGGQDSYTQPITDFNNTTSFFLEFRVFATGPRPEIPGGAPTVMATANSFGLGYNATVANDQVKLLRDVDLPILFVDVTSGIPHTIRLELYNDPPATYRWFIDGNVVDQGLAEGPFPAMDSRIAWRGKAWYFPTENAWDYIRFGEIPVTASGDFDGNGALELGDFYFFHECLSSNGPVTDAGPGCRWADLDGDTDVDLLDLAGFQNLFKREH